MNFTLFSVAVVSPDPSLGIAPNWWQAIFLGVVQGLTEFIPISSTAHLRIVPAILGWADPGASFTAVIQLGSLIAVLIYFASDLRTLLVSSWQAIRLRQFQAEPFRMTLGILVGTLPIVIVGLAIKKIWGTPPRQLDVIAAASIGLAILLAVAERWGKRERDGSDLGFWDGIWVGCAQALALIPGVSRSGSTITAGLFLNLQREVAARYSFLLGIPALLLAGTVEFISDFQPSSLVAQGLGILSAFVFSYLSIDFLIKFLKRQSLWIFIAYRVVLGIGILTALATNLLQNNP